jgi:phytanoyl-CoA hydroxylase
MLRALQQVTLRQKHSLQQIMVFEQSATPAHQDWFYLDSFPPGCLTAAWVALEDIHPNATRFFVIPGSQDFDKEFPEDWINGSSRYVEHMTELVHTEFKDRITIPEMRRGDVLFWNSRVIHGSFRGTDPTKSRLSLTAHYLPDGFSFGNRKNPILIKYPFDLVEGRPVSYLDHWVKLPNTKKVSWFGLRKTTPTR